MTPDFLSAAHASVRQAALLLHGMSPADRMWLLDQLSVEQQESLSTLLAELAELGVPSDADFVLQAVAMPVPGAPRTLASLSAAEVLALANLLKTEPPMLVAQLLAAGPWPWEKPLLSHFDTVKRRQVDACMSSLEDTQVPSRLRTAIVETVSSQVLSAREGQP